MVYDLSCQSGSLIAYDHSLPNNYQHIRTTDTLFIMISVTRLGDLLQFGQLFKGCGNNYFPQIAHIFRKIFVKVSKSFVFLVNTFLGNFYRHLATFYWSHWSWSLWYIMMLPGYPVFRCSAFGSLRLHSGWNRDRRRRAWCRQLPAALPGWQAGAAAGRR